MPTDPNLPPDADGLVARLGDMALQIEMFGGWNAGATDRRMIWCGRELWASDLRAVLAALTVSQAALEVAEAELVEARRVIAPVVEQRDFLITGLWEANWRTSEVLGIENMLDAAAQFLGRQALAPDPDPGEPK